MRSDTFSDLKRNFLCGAIGWLLLTAAQIAFMLTGDHHSAFLTLLINGFWTPAAACITYFEARRSWTGLPLAKEHRQNLARYGVGVFLACLTMIGLFVYSLP